MNDIHLKIKFLSLAEETRLIKKEEQKQLRRARRMFGVYSKKHGPDEELPEPPKPVNLSGEEREKIGSDAYSEWWGLKHHRLNVVRKEARKVHLIRNFLNGTPYKDVEATCHEEPNWDEVFKDLTRFVVSNRANDHERQMLKENFSTWAGLVETPVQNAA